MEKETKRRRTNRGHSAKASIHAGADSHSPSVKRDSGRRLNQLLHASLAQLMTVAGICLVTF